MKTIKEWLEDINATKGVVNREKEIAKHVFGKIFVKAEAGQKPLRHHAGYFKHWIQVELFNNAYLGREEMWDVMDQLGFEETEDSKYNCKHYKVVLNKEYLEKIGLKFNDIHTSRLELYDSPKLDLNLRKEFMDEFYAIEKKYNIKEKNNG